MAITLVAHTKVATRGTSTGIDTSTSTLLIVAFKVFSGTTVTFTDSKTNTWTQLTGYGDAGNNLVLYYALVTGATVGSAHTIGCADTNVFGYYFCSFAGTATASALDQFTGANTGSATSLKPGTRTPTTDNQLIFTGLLCTGTSPTINVSFITIDTDNQSAGVSYGGGLAYLVQTSAAAIDPTWSWTATGEGASGIYTFKAPAVVSTSQQQLGLLGCGS